MGTLQAIKEILNEGRLEDAMHQLNTYIISNPSDDDAYFTRGKLYVKLGDMPKAINDYCQAVEINPASPAGEAYDSLQEILNFYNTDLYNP